MRRLQPHNFPPEFAAHIHDKTEGHPLFATNLLQYLHERGDIAKTNEHWSLSRPLSEMELEVAGKRAQHDQQESGLARRRRAPRLQYASVEGQEFLSTVVAGLARCR